MARNPGGKVGSVHMPREHDWLTLYANFAISGGGGDAPARTRSLDGRCCGRPSTRPGRTRGWHGRLRCFSLPIRLADDWSRIEALRAAFEELQNLGYSAATPAQSVYQTAIQIMMRQLELERDREGEQRWFFRGQRREQWPTIPLTFRGLGGTLQPEESLLAQLARVRGAVRAIQESGNCSEEFQALAIAQHYSAELGVRPWLLDVTRSPYVALFFASDGGADGDIGVVDYVERTEWLFFSAGSPEGVGRIRYVAPTGVPRIENQAAFFIEAPHPEPYRQMAIRRYYFRQRAGITFEDTSQQPPVARDRIYPEDDALLRDLPKAWDGERARPLAWEPSPAALKLPDAALFASLVEPWLTAADQRQRETVAAICRLHAAVTREADALPHYIGTLHNLRRTVEAVVSDTFPDSDTLLEFFYPSTSARPRWPSASRRARPKQLRAGR